MTLFLNFRYAPNGGATRQDPAIWSGSDDGAVKALLAGQLSALAAGSDLVLAAHGYNNNQSEGLCALSRLERQLALPANILYVGVLWPGDSLAGFAGYPLEKRTAEDVGRGLARFCGSALRDAASLSFVSHSLGARVVLEAIRNLRRRAKTACLTAAAIERDCLTEEYADAFAMTDVVSVLASESDATLKRGFVAGNLIAQLLDPSANPLSRALGYAGPPAPVGKTVRPWLIKGVHGIGHHDYLPSCGPGDPLPVPGALCNEPVAFMRRALLQQAQTWPT